MPEANHPLAWRALLVAFVLQATSVACLYAPFTLLLAAVEARTGVGRDISSLGMFFASVTTALLAPFAGHFANRVPLRLLAALGAGLCGCGYALMALVPSVYAFLGAYGLLIGPGMALSGVVVPAIVVTRWYRVNRGRALGILHMPLLAFVSPLAVTWLLKGYGVAAAYWFMAGLMAVNLLLLPLLRNPPSGSGEEPPQPSPGWSDMKRIAAAPVFWALTIATTTVIAAGNTINTHLAPMVKPWGVGDTQIATLPMAGALAGALGAVAFGWLADRLGAARTLALCAFDTALLCAVFLLHPGYAVLLPLVGLLGLHLAGAVPALTLALSRIFGQESFGAAFGLSTFVFMVLSPFVTPIAGVIFARLHTYAPALLLLIGLLVAGMALALAGQQGAADRTARMS